MTKFYHSLSGGDKRSISSAAKVAANASGAKCLVAFTARGTAAQRMSRERPLQPILALTANDRSARRLALSWGLEARVVQDITGIEDMAQIAIDNSKTYKLANDGDLIVIVAGVPFGEAGSTNIMRIAKV